jgi:hypothetical protein
MEWSIIRNRSFETILLLDTIKANLVIDLWRVQSFVSRSVEDYEGETKYKQFQKVKANEYFNGLQVKFSYAITCHKSQGTVEYCFYRTTYLPNGIDRDYIRWLYTHDPSQE